jgi:purine-binding chemotaxis protein CheW
MPEQTRKFLIFSLQNSLFALDLSQIAEVADTPQMWPIPKAPACFSGALNFHGDIVAALNLPFFLGMTEFKLLTKIIVLQHEVASLAFLVETVVGIVREDEVSIGAAPETLYAAATLGLTSGKAILLDVDALVRSSEITMQNNR